MPKLYERKRYFTLSIVMVVLFASAVIIKPFDRLMHRSPENWKMRELKEMPPPFQAHEMKEPRPPQPRGNKKFSPPFDIVSIFLLVMLMLIVISSESVKKMEDD